MDPQAVTLGRRWHGPAPWESTQADQLELIGECARLSLADTLDCTEVVRSRGAGTKAPPLGPATFRKLQAPAEG